MTPMKASLGLMPVAALLATLLASCGEDSPAGNPPPALRPAIYGTVRSADSTPVSGLRVGVLYDIRPGGAGDTTSSPVILVPNPVESTVDLRFQVPKPDHVRIDIVRAYDSVVVAKLFDAVLAAGEYQVSYDARTLPNLVYLMRTSIGDFTVWRRFIVNSPDLGNMNALVRTGADGTFTIEYSWLQHGAQFNLVFEDGTSGGPIRIGDSLSILVARPDSLPTVWRIKLDTTVAVTRQFTIQ